MATVLLVAILVLTFVILTLVMEIGMSNLNAFATLGKKMSELSSSVDAIQASVNNIVAAVGQVSTSVAGVIDDLQNDGDVAKAVTALNAMRETLDNTANSARAAAESLTANDPTPPVSDSDTGGDQEATNS